MSGQLSGLSAGKIKIEQGISRPGQRGRISYGMDRWKNEMPVGKSEK